MPLVLVVEEEEDELADAHMNTDTHRRTQECIKYNVNHAMHLP